MTSTRETSEALGRLGASEYDAAHAGWYRPEAGRFSGPDDRVPRCTRGSPARQIEVIAPLWRVLGGGSGRGSLLEDLEGRDRAGRSPTIGRWLGCMAALCGALLIAAAPAPADQGRAPGGEMSAGLGFDLVRTSISPKEAYFAGERRVRLRYRFSAARRVDLRIAVIRPGSGRTVAAWRERKARPGVVLKRRWSGLTRRGRAARDGRYEFRVGAKGRPLRYAGRFRLRGHAFPVDGAHGSRGAVGQFGAARNGGRTHEGYDVLADCGTPLVAARGGKVRKVGYDSRLYGHFLLVNGSKTHETYFYSHLISAPSVRKGERVRTGQRVGRVGQTGNARSTPCHLHFELRRGGRAIDPWPELRRWDRWS